MKKTYLLTILLLSLSTTNLIYAYPPDNAAVIYYKLMDYFEKPDEAVWGQICDLPTSQKPASEEVKAFIQKQKDNNLIPELEIASELKHCDWGLDFSQGFEMLMPGLSQMKNFHYLLLADAAIQASEGNIDAALEKNLIVRRMAHHVSNDTLIGFLVSFALNKKSDEALGHLLGTYPLDEKTLVELKNELLWESYRPKPIRHPMMMEKEVCLHEVSIMTPQRYKKFIADWEQNECSEQLLELLEKNDPAFIDRSAAYLEKYYDKVFAIMEKPYAQAFQEIDESLKQAAEEAEQGKEEAVFTSVFCPALAKCYSHGINWKTNHDAMLTALDVYIAAAKTGKLPQKLPESTCIDHFSRKPFIYEVTEDGFTLKCQQEDLDKKTTYKFSYKLPK
ncbi:MAG: hypothetical protein ISS71_02215 [Phycisphaerae bacterium]|nr:hypothetical protein [Phycisphaerae bacterium]